MKIAMITGGQPRFTVDFINLMKQLSGFDSADIYCNFWTSSWAENNIQAEEKIKKVLLPGYNLIKVNITDQPKHTLPSNDNAHPQAKPENIRWWHERRIAMWESLAMAYNLIDRQYDLVIRFRPDGQLTGNLNLTSIDLQNYDFVMPNNGCGYKDFLVNDQFAIGLQSTFNLFGNITSTFNQLIIEVYKDWENNAHEWANEYILGHYLKSNNIRCLQGNFQHILTTQGRSKFTDKHYHLPISLDITE